MPSKVFTSRSAFQWEFAPHPQGRIVSPLKWGSFIEKGPFGKKLELTYEVKAFIDAWILHVELNGKTIGSLTVEQKFIHVRALARWMSMHSIWSFSKLTPALLESFFKEISQKNIATSTKPKTQQSLKTYCAIVRYLWTLRFDYKHHIKFDPFDVLRSILQKLESNEGAGWTPLNEKLALDLLNDSIYWIESVAPDVIVVVQHLYALNIELQGKTRNERASIMRRAYSELAQQEEYPKIEKILVGVPRPSLVVLRAIKLTIGACLNIIFGLVGMRAGEVTYLKRDCIVEESSEEQIVRKIHSVESKRHRERSWVVSELVCRAIATLQNLSPWITEPNERLFQAFNGNSPVPIPGIKLAQPGSDILNKRLRDFASSSHRNLPCTERVHPHRWRHTFARFVMKRDKRALGALADHYGHAYWRITDGVYASGRDDGMLPMLRESELEEIKRGYMHLLTAPRIAGKGAAQFDEVRGEVARQTFQGKPTLQAMVESHLKRGVLKLAPCSWGYCVYEQSLSACKGNKVRPNEVTRTPSLCSSCVNFVVTPDQRQFWEERYEADEKFLARSAVNEQSRRYVENRLATTIQIIKSIV